MSVCAILKSFEKSQYLSTKANELLSLYLVNIADVT